MSTKGELWVGQLIGPLYDGTQATLPSKGWQAEGFVFLKKNPRPRTNMRKKRTGANKVEEDKWEEKTRRLGDRDHKEGQGNVGRKKKTQQSEQRIRFLILGL